MAEKKGRFKGELRGEFSKKMDKSMKGPKHIGSQNMSMSMSGKDRQKVVRMKEEQARQESLRGKWS